MFQLSKKEVLKSPSPSGSADFAGWDSRGWVGPCAHRTAPGCCHWPRSSGSPVKVVEMRKLTTFSILCEIDSFTSALRRGSGKIWHLGETSCTWPMTSSLPTGQRRSVVCFAFSVAFCFHTRLWTNSYSSLGLQSSLFWSQVNRCGLSQLYWVAWSLKWLLGQRKACDGTGGTEAEEPDCEPGLWRTVSRDSAKTRMRPLKTHLRSSIPCGGGAHMDCRWFKRNTWKKETVGHSRASEKWTQAGSRVPCSRASFEV